MVRFDSRDGWRRLGLDRGSPQPHLKEEQTHSRPARPAQVEPHQRGLALGPAET
jgi:hypothetical protein